MNSIAGTDHLARHPGRPWTADPRQDPVPDYVLGHYRALSVEELATRLLRHYEQMWPTVEALIIRHARNPGSTRLILEGSAILPDGVAALPAGNVAAMWLTADPGVLADRIRALSRFEEADHDEQALVCKFIARTVRYQRIILGAVGRHGLPAIRVADDSTTDDLVERCLQVASSGSLPLELPSAVGACAFKLEIRRGSLLPRGDARWWYPRPRSLYPWPVVVLALLR